MAKKYYVVHVKSIQQLEEEELDRKLARGEIPSDTLMISEKEYERIVKRHKSWTDYAKKKYKHELEQK
ncbi:MAG: hypothetical protein NZ894_05920 [Archaeoglobaceae archaeon]|nr:hypothetical protein [Archaeoglobaceae archaeon]